MDCSAAGLTQSGLQEGIQWRIKETARPKIAAARLSAKATVGCTFGSGKRARCPSRATRRALSRSATRFAPAPAACAKNISRRSMARRPLRHPPAPHPKLLLLKHLRRKLLLPDPERIHGPLGSGRAK